MKYDNISIKSIIPMAFPLYSSDLDLNQTSRRIALSTWKQSVAIENWEKIVISA